MSRKGLGPLALALLAIVAFACSDSSTPTTPADPAGLTSISAEARGSNNAGGKGSPHFVLDATSCSFDVANGHMTCNYMVAGLGKYGRAEITLAGAESFDWYCGTSTRERSLIDIFAEVEIWADKSGNYKGVLEADPWIDWNAWCLGSTPHTEHWELGPWSLTGVADTAAGPFQFMFYLPPG